MRRPPCVCTKIVYFLTSFSFRFFFRSRLHSFSLHIGISIYLYFKNIEQVMLLLIKLCNVFVKFLNFVTSFFIAFPQQVPLLVSFIFLNPIITYSLTQYFPSFKFLSLFENKYYNHSTHSPFAHSSPSLSPSPPLFLLSNELHLIV